MPDNPRNHPQQQDATLGDAADRRAKAAGHDSFPASDPTGTTGAVGVRAVDLAWLSKPQVEIRDPTIVVARLPDQLAAKLAVERLVRKIPLDRRHTSVQDSEDGTVILEVAAAEVDVERIAEMLRRYGEPDD